MDADAYGEGWADAMFWAAKILREANTDTSRKCLVDRFEELRAKPIAPPESQVAEMVEPR